jgi:hypothetical protein
MAGSESALTVMGWSFGPGQSPGRLGRCWPELLELVNGERPDLLMLQGCTLWERLAWQVDHAREDFGMRVLVAPSRSEANSVLCVREERLRVVEWTTSEPPETFQGFGVGVLADRVTGRMLAAASVDLHPLLADRAQGEARRIGELCAAFPHDAIMAGEFRRVSDANVIETPALADRAGWTAVRDGQAEVEEGATDGGSGRGSRMYVTQGLAPGVVGCRAVAVGDDAGTLAVIDLAPS